MNIISKIIDKWLCMHNYNLEHHIKITTDYGEIYHNYIYMCNKCGKIEKVSSH